ncbi:MAG: pyrimidine/purine nucleoside phosphorylase [Desulfobacteraceae bacterium]|nr:pyrimidine/purine nucleoside phosphorylase [Desulfobacteraceae bacterium]
MPVNINNRKGTLMSEFRDVTVIKKANIYFDGKVASRSVIFPDGSRKTLGVMLPGEYEFNTGDKEIMEVISGELDVLLPNNDEWKAIKAGDMFEVPASSKFSLKIRSITDYCCSFVR